MAKSGILARIKMWFSTMQAKMLIVLIVFGVFCSGVLILRLFHLQIVEGEKYRDLASQAQTRSSEISSERGTIYDRNMKTLAKSASAWNVVINPSKFKDDAQRKEVASGLSDVLGIDVGYIYEKCLKTNAYQSIKKRVDKETRDKIIEFKEATDDDIIFFEEDTRRYYPYNSLASTLIGFTNYDGEGGMGIEAYYNKVLSGTPGRITVAKDGNNKDMKYRYQELYQAENGNSLVLTIDETIQHFVEKHLDTAIIEHGVVNGAIGIVMDVNTGEVLAMSSKPDFNPNSYQEVTGVFQKELLEESKSMLSEEEYKKLYSEMQVNQWRNRAVSDPYEPGSVFKLITAAGGLDCGALHLTDSFVCTGSLEVAGRRVGCWKTGGHGLQTFTDTVKNSCNPAFITYGQKMGVENFSKYFDAFGLTEPTGIDLPGEGESIYYRASNMGISELSSAAFGQTFKVTPIQLITAISAALNGGNLMQPYVVKQVLDADGNVIETTDPVVKRQVIPESVSKQVRDLGLAVVHESGGSGRRAGIPGYLIGGKTGTSEKLDEYDENGQRVGNHILSFLGFAPADDPEIAILVALDSPTIKVADGKRVPASVYGSVIAAPVVGAIFNDILPYMGIEPSFTESELTQKQINVPYLLGMKPHDAQSELTLVGLQTRIIGNGTEVVKQVPDVGESIPSTGTVIIYTEDGKTSTTTVPNVVGLTPEEANRSIINAELNIEIDDSATGKNVVVQSQQPTPGEIVEIGTVVSVTFTQQAESDKNKEETN